MATTAAEAVGIVDLCGRPALDRLAERLAERRALIVLDNCEHQVDACAELAGALLSACPACVCWRRAASRSASPVSTCSPAMPLKAPDEAVEVLRDRACAVRPNSGSPMPTGTRSPGCRSSPGASAWTRPRASAPERVFPEQEVLDVLDRLVIQSVVLPADEEGMPRYRCDRPPVRSGAARRVR
ncbi:hypothetical protein O1M63_37265 [Streptomyces mirabilis]|nr:hypothetical protein [Streptomyces mirabilis]